MRTNYRCAAGVLALACATFAFAGETQPSGPSSHSNASPGVPQPIPLGAAPDYRAIVAQNRAAVVGITAEFVDRGRSPRSQQDDADGDRDSYPENASPYEHTERGSQEASSANTLGSGFIVSSDGLVLTNAHVVGGSAQVTVKLADRREFRAKLLGSDKVTDIALVKIDARDLPFVRVGNSDEVNVGDYVLAIGAPFGLEETATSGIVSAKSRSLPDAAAVSFIQTDAAVNPGNSGGPLFDASGAVIGVNSQIYSTSGGFQGLAFAIPINVARRVQDQILKMGRAEHGRLGIETQSLDQPLATSFRLTSPRGALVAAVEPHSAAEKAGVKIGDVIVKFDGQRVDDSGQLSSRVSMFAPGQLATMDLVRAGAAVTVQARIDSDLQPEELAAREAAIRQRVAVAARAQLGLALRPLNARELLDVGVGGGLLVEDAEGSAAAAGIEEGNVILAVDGTEVRSVEQFRRLVAAHDDIVPLLVQSEEGRVFIPVNRR